MQLFIFDFKSKIKILHYPTRGPNEYDFILLYFYTFNIIIVIIIVVFFKFSSQLLYYYRNIELYVKKHIKSIIKLKRFTVFNFLMYLEYYCNTKF